MTAFKQNLSNPSARYNFVRLSACDDSQHDVIRTARVYTREQVGPALIVDRGAAARDAEELELSIVDDYLYEGFDARPVSISAAEVLAFVFGSR